jgi:TrmH family RNA methyltransferase
VRRIASSANELVKEIKSLDLKKNRHEYGLFVAEGARTVIEALELGAGLKVVAYLEAARSEPHVARIADAVIQSGGMCLEVSAEVLERLSRRDNPQTVIGVFAQGWQTLDEVGARHDRLLALEQVRDPGNLGTILRTADALGYRGVMLVGDCTDPYALEAVRASMGSLFAVDLARVTLEEFLAWRAGYQGLVVGTHLAGAVDIRSIQWPKQRLVVMGNEQQGLSEAMAKACTQLIKIPMSGRADSLNLAIATGISLFESVRGA